MTIGALLAASATAEIGLAVVMACAWLVQRLTGASGWIDAIWTLGVGLAGVALAFGFGAATGGAAWRVVLVASLAAAWSLRLGAHIIARSLKAGDDPRYRRLVEDWGDAAPRRSSPFYRLRPSPARCWRSPSDWPPRRPRRRRASRMRWGRFCSLRRSSARP